MVCASHMMYLCETWCVCRGIH